jgi:alpha-tubulin suppressor-like RCC1 family protein
VPAEYLKVHARQWARPHAVCSPAGAWDVSTLLPLHVWLGAEDGAVWSWGSNKYGQLGFPLDVAHCLEPKRLPIDGGTAVACGAAHSAVLTGRRKPHWFVCVARAAVRAEDGAADRGELFTFGENSYGQLGLGHIGKLSGDGKQHAGPLAIASVQVRAERVSHAAAR